MSSYHQMRRQARHARRAGMQPMMIINGDQFPTPLGIILARAAWRYRSELAPLYLAIVVAVAGWWAHAAYPHQWAIPATVTVALATALIGLGKRIGLATLAERLYAATVADISGGSVVGPGGIMQVRGYPRVVATPRQATDRETRQRLWEVSEQLTGVRYRFPVRV